MGNPQIILHPGPIKELNEDMGVKFEPMKDDAGNLEEITTNATSLLEVRALLRREAENKGANATYRTQHMEHLIEKGSSTVYAWAYLAKRR